MNDARRLDYERVDPTLECVGILMHRAVASHDQRIAVATDTVHLRKPTRHTRYTGRG